MNTSKAVFFPKQGLEVTPVNLRDRSSEKIHISISFKMKFELFFFWKVAKELANEQNPAAGLIDAPKLVTSRSIAPFSLFVTGLRQIRTKAERENQVASLESDENFDE